MEALGIKWTPEVRNIVNLKHWDKNPRKISPESYARLKAKITSEGMHQVLTIDTDNTVLSGNQRLDILTELAVPEIWCMVPERALTAEERDKVGIQANVLEGTWNMEALRSFDLSMLRFQGLQELKFPRMASGDPDDVPEMRPETISQPGDVFQIGEHVLLCGDSNVESDMEKLMGTKKANMVFTDPPWNVAIGGDGNPRHRQRAGLVNDDIGAAFGPFLENVARTIEKYNDGDVYCVMGCEQWPTIHAALTGVGMHWSATIVWVKDIFVLGRSKYHRRYEPIWYGWKEKSSYVADRRPTSTHGYKMVPPVLLEARRDSLYQRAPSIWRFWR